ncbi:hypothetical protein SpCBS45565_g00154 [Spizellomyces sp. 'palustris']|nr:hypothetical protein SpCBS45565_g00154 [Spizellomyces sp. 'palustris']
MSTAKPRSNSDVITTGSRSADSQPSSATLHHEHVPLSHTLAAEAASAFASAGLVAPIITIIDSAIFRNASGTEPLFAGLASGARTFVTRPFHFIRQPACLFMFGVYAGTYLTANTIQSVCDYEGWDWFYPKFVGTSIANVGLCVAKDVCFTRWFGSGKARPVPWSSFALYTSRDCLTIFASFNLPAILSQKMTTSWGIDKRPADIAAQLLTPCAVQFISTPMHLLGMDLYNRPAAQASERGAFIAREYGKSTSARIGRIFAAFGIGGVANQYFRHNLKGWLHKVHGSG